MDKFEAMIPIEEAFAIVDRALAGTNPTGELMPVREAHGRTLLTDQTSRVDLPAFDKSAMDGYAVLPDDEREEYRVLETVRAGHVGRAELVPGTAVKVMTGAAVPDLTGRVIMVERTQETGDLVKVHRHDRASNVCRKGEDVRVGDVIMAAGTVLGSLEIANLIACGVARVEVAKRVRVAVMSTGDEIVDSPDLLAPGKIMNSNGPMLAGLAREFGLDVVDEESVPDDADATGTAIRGAMDRADVVILSGGVSVGEFDYVLDAFADLGLTVQFSRIAVKPGKPTVFATAPGKAVFGLPGNPVSVFVMFHLFVLRAAALISGRAPGTRELRLPLANEMKRKKADRQSFVPGRLTEDGTVEPVAYHGSAHLLALMRADGFISVPVGVGELNQGDRVAFIPITRGGRW